MNKPFSCIVLALTCSLCTWAQSTSANSGTVRGTVLDPSGAAVKGATVQIQNPVSRYNQSAQTDSSGRFEFDNVPYNPYHTTALAAGFETAELDADVHSAIPVELKFSLKIGTSTTSLTVTDAGDLLETDPTAHTDVDRALFDKLPLESRSSSVSSLITLSSPGISADSNGLFHGLGDHAQNSFSVDGQPITDQQSKVFSNQLPLDSVQSVEVIAGAPPAEYGGKTSVVIVVTTRSGLGAIKPHGEITGSWGSFDSADGGANLAYGGNKAGNYISVGGLNTSRFLDGPEHATIHDHGNQQNIFDRLDFKVSHSDTLGINLGLTRSWFQTPNSYDSQNATAWSGLVVDNGGLGPDGKPVGAQDQRSKIRTFNIAPAWTRLLNSSSALTIAGFIREDQYNYYPSANPFADLTPGGLQAQTIGQDRTLKNTGGRVSYTYSHGVHNLKLGATYQDTFLKEKDNLGLIDPTANAPCVDADGNPVTDPGLTNPDGCGSTLQPNPNFNPLLACYDLTRTGKLPASDGCLASTSGLYSFNASQHIDELALFIQDAITVKSWTFNLGLRFDHYHGLAAGSLVQPRMGIAYHVKRTNSVVRVSYARSMETPFNENLILASNGCDDAVVSAIVGSCSGGGTPLGPAWRNEFHAGLQQALGRYFVVDAEYIWKYTHRAYDFSVLGSTPITFPVEWASSKIPGYTVRGSVPNFHGLTAFVVMSSVAARFFTPQISGIGATPGGSSVFRIDHDEKFNLTAHLQYQFKEKAPWISFNWRYDSGLVAGAVPCAGGNCNNGPNGDDTTVDVSGLTPDQQFQAGLFCGSVHATPTTPISATGLCAASQYGSALLQIPAAGTEDDDHNPPRVASRSLFDIAVGHDNIFRGHDHKVSARLTVVNLMDKTALYNFLSTFSGTHYVTPRAVTLTVGFHF